MPAIVIKRHPGCVPHPNCSISQIEDIVKSTIHQFYRYKVLLFTPVVQDQSVTLASFELEIITHVYSLERNTAGWGTITSVSYIDIYFAHGWTLKFV